MTDDQNKEPAANDAPKKRRWPSLPGRRSVDPATVGITEDDWTWLGDDATAIHPNRSRLGAGPKIAGALVCCALVAGVIAFVVTSTGNSGDAQVNALASRSPTAAATSIATVHPSTVATRTPAAPTPKIPLPPAAPTPVPTPIPTGRFGPGANIGGLIGGF